MDSNFRFRASGDTPHRPRGEAASHRSRLPLRRDPPSGRDLDDGTVSQLLEELGQRFARDSPLEGDGFEPSVPRLRRSCGAAGGRSDAAGDVAADARQQTSSFPGDMLSAATLKARIRLNSGLGPTSSMVIEMRGPCDGRGTAPSSLR